MSFGIWVVFVIILLAIAYTISNPEIIKYQTFTNPFSKSQNNSSNNSTFIYNNSTPSSNIFQTPTRTYLGLPWQYFGCANGGGDMSCKSSYGPGSTCDTNASSSTYNQCYFIK